MIVNEVMTTKLVIVQPGDTLSHAANLLRQYHFHHLPVAHISRDSFQWDPSEILDTKKQKRDSLPVLEGLLSSEDIDLAVALDAQGASEAEHLPWQERRVAEVMHPVTVSVSQTTSVGTASQLLVERGINCLPVVEYIDSEDAEQRSESAQETLFSSPEPEASSASGVGGLNRERTRTVLVGLLTRSDLLMVLARTLGSFEPGVELHIPLPGGDLAPLARMLMLAAELHIRVRHIIAAPIEGTVMNSATVRLGTIHPTPLLVRLKEANIVYEFANAALEDNAHV